MPLEKKSGWLGLVTNVGELQAPPGALKRAENVVIRRAGVVEQRPGAYRFDDLALSGDAMLKLVPYAESTLACYDDGGNAEWWDVDADAAVQYTPLSGGGATNPALFRADLIPDACARGNLYVGYRDGVLKWDGAGAFETAGVPPTFYIYASNTSTNTPTWLPTASRVAYRVVAKKTDSNGLIVRSKPSGAVIVENAAGADRSVFINIYVHATTDFDELEVYRTRTFSTSITPDEEYQLVGVVPVTGTTNQFRDYITDDQRGATLYTSPSREGIEGGNDCPPAAGALALFRGSLFFGNVAGPKRKVVSYYDRGAISTATGIGTRSITVDTVSGSNVVTNASSTTGLQKGMTVPSAGVGAIPDRAWITNISGTTITLSANCTATVVGQAATFEDSVYVNSEWYGVSTLTGTSSIASINRTSGTVVAHSQTPPKGGYTDTLVIETIARGSSASLTLKATHGDEFDPVLPLYDDTAEEGDQDVWPHGLMWSKPDEPEHVPAANYQFVGDKTGDLLALAATRDALFVLKTDGIWRATGTNGQWRIDPFDMTTRCILPSSVSTMNGRVYALTNRGVVAISDEGVQVVSLAIADQLKGLIHSVTIAGAPYAVTRNEQALGYVGTCNERDSEYVLLVGDLLSEASSEISGALVYNEHTQAWTSWDWSDLGDAGFVPNCVAYSPKDSTVLIGSDAAPERLTAMAEPLRMLDTPSADRAYACDGEVTITITNWDSSTRRITYTPAYQLAAGDVVVTLSGGGTAYRITTAVSTTVVALDGTDTPLGGGARAYRPITCTVEPRGFVDPDQAMKLWQAVYAGFSELVGPVAVTYGVRSSIKLQSAEESGSLDVEEVEGAAVYELGALLRGDVPDSAARGWRFACSVGWAMTYGAVALESISVEYREGRTNRPNLAVGAS
jgi:hypothetical protein